MSLPAYVVDDMNRGFASLVVDYSNESGTQQHVLLVDRELAERGLVAQDACLYLAQNRLLKATPRVAIRSYDTFIVTCATDIRRELEAPGAVERLCVAAAQPADKTHLLLCLNGTPRPHRLHVGAMLVERGLLGRSRVSFPGFDYAKSTGLDPHAELQRLSRDPRRRFLVSSVEAFIARLPLRVDAFTDQGNALASKIALDPYVDTVASLVTETSVAAGVLRITEKSIKPVGLGHVPFVYGPPGAIGLLQGFGFDVFDDLVSQDYDGIEDSVDRLVALFDAIAGFDEILRQSAATLGPQIGMRVQANLEWICGGFLARYHSEYARPVLAWIQGRITRAPALSSTSF